MMKKLSIILLAFAFWTCNNNEKSNNNTTKPEYLIVIHGGAGTIKKEDLTPELEENFHKALNEALSIGENILKNGGTSMDAVSETIAYMEDCPLFNAGKGAVFNAEGKNELDASIMDGKTQMAGAVSGVSIVKNPIKLARAVFEKSPHVFLSGKGADQFAIENKLDTVSPSYFFTQPRWESYLRTKAEKEGKKYEEPQSKKNIDKKFGTVGCVCLDKSGNLAAGTSTGGMTYKKWNRVGDAPVIGAGTYADNASAAISCTGHGEYFIRYTVAKDIAARVEYKGESIIQAADDVIMKKLVEKGGEGGMIGIDKNGNFTMTFNSAGMYRGYAKANGERKTLIYK